MSLTLLVRPGAASDGEMVSAEGLSARGSAGALACGPDRGLAAICAAAAADTSATDCCEDVSEEDGKEKTKKTKKIKEVPFDSSKKYEFQKFRSHAKQLSPP